MMLSLRYSRRGAWVQCQAILRHVQTASQSASACPTAAPHVWALPLLYHHTISALAAAQGFLPALALYREQSQPHPLSAVPLLQVLSQWKEVREVGVMMQICEHVVHAALSLQAMSDEDFLRLHPISCSESEDQDEALQWMPEPATSSGRKLVRDELLGSLFQSLGPHRGK